MMLVQVVVGRLELWYNSRPDRNSNMSPPQEEWEEGEDTSLSQKDLGSILREQYEFTESFCNATTSLHNAVMQAGSSHSRRNAAALNLYQTTQDYQEALANVQGNLRLLESMISAAAVEESSDVGSHHQKPICCASPSLAEPIPRPRQQRHCRDNPLNQNLRAHVARTRRVLATIYSSGQGASFHANGLPTSQSSLSSSLPPPLSTSMQSSESDSSANASRLVALATLRSSIQTVTENLSSS